MMREDETKFYDQANVFEKGKFKRLIKIVATWHMAFDIKICEVMEFLTMKKTFILGWT